MIQYHNTIEEKVPSTLHNYCSHICLLLQDALREAGITDYLLIEIENREDCSEIQNYMQKITGARSVSLNLYCFNC